MTLGRVLYIFLWYSKVPWPDNIYDGSLATQSVITPMAHPRPANDKHAHTIIASRYKLAKQACNHLLFALVLVRHVHVSKTQHFFNAYGIVHKFRVEFANHPNKTRKAQVIKVHTQKIGPNAPRKTLSI